MLSLQVSIVGGLAIVTTAGYVKNELQMQEAFYPVAMAVMGVGAMLASLYYVRCDSGAQKIWSILILPAFLVILTAAALHGFQTTSDHGQNWTVTDALYYHVRTRPNRARA